MCNPNQLVQNLWNYYNILRDYGLSYGNYVEQLTFLLFLKIANEQANAPFEKTFRRVGRPQSARFAGAEHWTVFVHSGVLSFCGLEKKYERQF